MTVKTIHYLAIALLAAAVCACQKEPSTSGLHKDYLVYTAHDTNTDFAALETYYRPDRILLIGESDETKYWEDASAQEIIARVAAQLDAAGYQRIEDKETADAGIQMSYVEKETYYVGYDNPYWWWYYPDYCAPSYWGDWIGWYYPYRVYYGYTSGSLLIEMLDLDGSEESGKKLPVVWNSFIGGLLSASEKVNLQRTLSAVDQAFAQSPYLHK